jgi:hypothetical protein
MPGTLIVTSIRSRQIVECIQFDNQQGQSQLLCILNGETSAFKISCDETGTCEISKRKIRFVHDEFQKQLDLICQEAKEAQLSKLCSLLVSEISQGRVVVETKNRDGKVVAITSPSLAEKLASHKYTGKHGKTKEYENVECAGKGFFKEIAEGFDKNLQSVLVQLVKFNKDQNDAEKSHLEAVKKELDRKIIAQTEASWSLPGFFRGILEFFCTRFMSQTNDKIIANIVTDARKQAHEVQEKQAQVRKKHRRIRSDERKQEIRKQENLKQDINLSEKKLDLRTLEARAQEASLSSHSAPAA